MTMAINTRESAKTNIERKQNFSGGNMRGYWFSPKEITGDNMGGLPAQLQVILHEQNQKADVFVVFSYSNPIAWFSLKDSDSKGTNKWYFPTPRYGESMDQHQAIVRAFLQTLNPRDFAKILPNGKQMK